MNTQALQQIVERLEAGETGREIDALVADALGILPATPGDRIQFVGLPEGLDAEQMARDAVTPDLSTSLDAVVALHDELLPGWSWRAATCSVSDDAWTMPDFNHPEHGERLKQQFPSEEAQHDPLTYLGTDVDMRPPGRPAAALLAAILKALIATEQEQ